MQYYSTRNRTYRAGLEEALFRGLPADNGLYMPERIDALPSSFWQDLPKLSFSELSFRVARNLLGDVVPERELRDIVEEAINFPAPVVKLDDRRYVLELFHGPSLAFKDFGARFMSRLMGYFNQEEKQPLIILVATSGDTGGAVAAGFYQTLGIEVVILYPSGKVSQLQEKQLTTLGHNIHALEVSGTFDDCQRIVKQAFLDEKLRRRLRLSSANSINIARLIPQSFYYFEAYRQLGADGDPLVFCVPSGNFGNLTAGLLAHRMGLRIHHFIAATNQNDVVPEYLVSGQYRPRPSVPTLSNAMDVGAPSNFARMTDLFARLNNFEVDSPEVHRVMRELISGFAYGDSATEQALREVRSKFDYVIDPHGAVGYLALSEWQREHPHTRGIILGTAHPSKFKPDVERILGEEIVVPQRLAALVDRPKQAIQIGTDYQPVREWLLNEFE